MRGRFNRKLISIVLVAIITLTIFTLSAMISRGLEQKILLNLKLEDAHGEPIKNATVYVWALRPGKPSVLVGSFDVKDGTLKVNIREKLMPILEEWMNHLKEKGIIGLMRTALWITVAYPGGIDSGHTILIDPTVLLLHGGTLSKRIEIHKEVNYLKPKPVLVGSPQGNYKQLSSTKKNYNLPYETVKYTIRDSWIPVLIVMSKGSMRVKADYYLGSFSLTSFYSRGGWFETPEVSNLEEFKKISDGNIVYHVGGFTVSVSNAQAFGSRVIVTESNDLKYITLLAYVEWCYEEILYKIVDVAYGTVTYKVEARTYITDFLREIDENTGRLTDNLETKVVDNYDYSWLKDYGYFKTYGTFEGKGIIDLSDPEWSNKIEDLGDQGVIPKITEEDVITNAEDGVLEIHEYSFYLPLGSIIADALSSIGAETYLPFDLMAPSVTTITWGFDSMKVKFRCYSDAPPGINYTVKYLISKYAYKYDDENKMLRLPLTFFIVYEASDYSNASSGGSGGNVGPGGGNIRNP